MTNLSWALLLATVFVLGWLGATLIAGVSVSGLGLVVLFAGGVCFGVLLIAGLTYAMNRELRAEERDFLV